MIEALSFTLAGGLARLHDGGRLPLIQKVPPNLIYGIFSVSLWAFIAQPFDDNVLMLITGLSCLVAWANLQRSYGGWDSWKNVLHFAPVGAFATVLGWVNGNFWLVCGYCAALLIIGALRPAFSKFAPQSHNWTRYVEFAEGAIVFGGLSAVQLVSSV